MKQFQYCTNALPLEYRIKAEWNFHPYASYHNCDDMNQVVDTCMQIYQDAVEHAGGSDGKEQLTSVSLMIFLCNEQIEHINFAQ